MEELEGSNGGNRDSGVRVCTWLMRVVCHGCQPVDVCPMTHAGVRKLGLSVWSKIQVRGRKELIQDLKREYKRVEGGIVAVRVDPDRRFRG